MMYVWSPLAVSDRSVNSVGAKWTGGISPRGVEFRGRLGNRLIEFTSVPTVL